MKIRVLSAAIHVLLIGGIVSAQTSKSFRLEDYTFDAGGSPYMSSTLGSASFGMAMVSIGDGIAATGLTSSSYGLDAGFDVAFVSPGEVSHLLLTDKQTLVWDAERSAGTYNLYRDDSSGGYGNCTQQGIATTMTTDAAIPTTDNAFYYLVTATNRLALEGTKGFQGNNAERLGGTGFPTCP